MGEEIPSLRAVSMTFRLPTSSLTCTATVLSERANAVSRLTGPACRPEKLRGAHLPIRTGSSHQSESRP